MTACALHDERHSKLAKGEIKEAAGRQRQREDRAGLSRVTEGCGKKDGQRWRKLVRERTGRDFPESQRAVGRRTEMEAAGQGVDRTGLSRVTEGYGRQTVQRWRQLVERSSVRVVPLPTTFRVKGQIER